MNVSPSPIQTMSIAAGRELILGRRAQKAEADAAVRPIIERVRAEGDAALFDFARQFDGFDRSDFIIGARELTECLDSIDRPLRLALETAITNIEGFARLQLPREFMVELTPGMQVGQIVRPLQRVAGYIPGGRYPLPSTVLMTCVPAMVAGVPSIWVTTPKPNPVVLAAAKLAGATEVAILGGAHAIVAFALGTQSIPRADRIVGPGNRYVTAAKRLLSSEVGIDFDAGPTEVLVIADEGDPAFIAADLIAQAEHDTDACSILLTTSASLAGAVANALERQLEDLSTAEIARASLARNGALIVCDSKDAAIQFSNEMAPEHLCLYDPSDLGRIQNAGSVFLGPWSPEAAGDYLTGPNHVLPTAQIARLRGGLSVADMVKVISVQQLSPEGLAREAEKIALLARAEGLEGHARSVEVRARGAAPSAPPGLPARPEIVAMKPYVPPTSGRAGNLRLDFNENTVGAGDAVVSAAKQALNAETLSMYPDYERAREAIARQFGVGNDQLTLTNGTDEAIQLIVNTYVGAGDEVIVLKPTYAMFRFYAEVMGARVVEVPLTDRDGGFVLEPESLIAAITPRTRAVFLPNPNNPTGTLVPLADIARILDAASRAAVLVDEAYFEFSGVTAMPWIGERSNLFVSRTMSKAHGLAGLRAGVLCGPSREIERVRKGQSPYSVNAVAASALVASIDQGAHVQAYVEQAVASRELIRNRLTARGIECWRSAGNFVLFRAGDLCEALLTACRDQGILIRDRRSDVPGTLRVTAGTRAQAERFLEIVEGLR